MKVTQEKLPASQIGLEIEIPAETSQKAYEQTVQKFMRQANIPGFRKGKVPRQVILQQFGVAGLKAATLEDLIDDSLQAALKQEGIKAIGNLQLVSSFEELIQKFEPGSPLTFSAAVDVHPEVSLKQYKGLAVKAEEVLYDPSRVDQVLETYREQVATLVPVENRPAQAKDTVVVDFKGVLSPTEAGQEPEEFAGNEAQDFQLVLQEGQFVEGFVSGIIGMTPGETKDVEAKFPESYPVANLAGRTAVFTVTLKELKEKELPELDDDFAQDVSDYETLAELRESLEKRFEEEAQQKTKANKERAILDELLNQVEVDLPETLIEQESNYMLNQTAVELQNRGMDIRQIFNQETIPKLRQEIRPEAIARIKRTLALGEIAKLEAIEVTEAETTERMNEILEDLQDTSEIDQDRLKEVVTEELLKQKIVDWLIENTTIELVPEGTLTPTETEEDATQEDLKETVSSTADGADETPAATDAIAVNAVEVLAAPDNPANAPANMAEEAAPETDAESASEDVQVATVSSIEPASEDVQVATVSAEESSGEESKTKSKKGKKATKSETADSDNA